MAKPDGLVAVAPGDERDFFDLLPIGLIWGVGPTTERRLHEAGISTIGQLAKTGRPILGSLLGKAVGAKLAALSANVMDGQWKQRPIRSPWVRKQPSDGGMQHRSSSERRSAT